MINDRDEKIHLFLVYNNQSIKPLKAIIPKAGKFDLKSTFQQFQISIIYKNNERNE